MSTIMISNAAKEMQKEDLQKAYDRLEQAVTQIEA
jgi:hypothetical protein